MPKHPLLEINDLTISFGRRKSRTQVVHGISLQVKENEIVGIVGESGSGKSVTSLAMMGLLPTKNTTLTGTVYFEGKNLLEASDASLRKLRGNDISMIFQEPMSALNPSLRCGFQVQEILRQHTALSLSEAKKETLSLFEKVKLPRPNEIYRSYPHQISGGQMQRVMIAMAIACKPKLLIADEPTTALDVTVQKEILLLLKSLQKETGMGMIFISHDLSLVSEIADRVVVMYQGNIVETGNVQNIFKAPEAAYTKALLNARPTLDKRLATLPTIASLADGSFQPKEVTPQMRAMRHKKMYTEVPLLQIQNVSKVYYSNAGLFQMAQIVRAVDEVSFSVYEGETLGLVGESGCGKSTLGKTILQLEPATSGSILYRGTDLTQLSSKAIRTLRKEIQLIFQDPYSSLNPRIPIGEALIEPMQVHKLEANDRKRKQRAVELLHR
ncbi:MAG: ABC transporter ATP-binding protein, partial [Marinirhabdus sp.]|nr:ABC transporter ATP-binding protein [Marinirhabdus sp.]